MTRPPISTTRPDRRPVTFGVHPDAFVRVRAVHVQRLVEQLTSSVLTDREKVQRATECAVRWLRDAHQGRSS